MAEGHRSETQSQHLSGGSERSGAEKSAYSLRVCGLRRMGRRSTRKRGEAESVGDSKRQSLAAETGSSAKSLVRHHADSRSVVQNARCRTGRSIAKLSDKRRVTGDQWQRFSLVTCLWSLFTSANDYRCPKGD